MIQVTMEEFTVLTCIRRHWQRYGYAPSVSDIKAGCGIRSRATVFARVQSLENVGLLCRSDKRYANRTLRPVDALIGVAP
jgi:SOS-response transcriptional repressor LexA